jgi:hypothetical protein
LVQQILLIGIGDEVAFDFAHEFAIHGLPALKGFRPLVGRFAEHMQPRAHVFAPFRVVRCGG